FTDAARVPIASVDVSSPVCMNGTAFTPGITTVLVTITDINANIMPQGTTVTFSTTNGTIVSAPTTFIVPNSTACLAGAGPGFVGGTVATGFVCPASSAVPLGSAPLSYAVTVTSDATVAAGPPAVCTNPKPTGVLTVTVTTPKGVITSVSIPVTD